MNGNENTMQNAEQQAAATPTPEAEGGQSEKLFTQADLDRIIGERLNREREKLQTAGEEDAREQALKAREARLDCREYLDTQGFPAALMDVLDTSDSEKFKAAVEALDKMVQLPSRNRKPLPHFGRPAGGVPTQGAVESAIADIFKPKI